jgi:SAM-dependent methyltransferase
VSRLLVGRKKFGTLLKLFSLKPKYTKNDLKKNSLNFRNLTWESKAKSNLMWAIQTTEDVYDLENKDIFNREIPAVRAFWKKGSRIYQQHLLPIVGDQSWNPDWCVVEYGCGVGRILENFSTWKGEKIGLDISREQIKFGQKINPNMEFRLIQKIGNDLDGKADFLYSFAVFKHIGKLSEYEQALRKCCRITKIGGILALNLHSEDFANLEDSETLNFEHLSIQLSKQGTFPPKIHLQDSNWSGVYVGWKYLQALLWHEGIRITSTYQHNPLTKQGNVWIIGIKDSDPKKSHPIAK